ncbi:hypothetical protein M8C21_025275, partial [Ambrosia artemisiifolia]
MGRFVMPRQYFHLPKTVKQYLDKEKKKLDQRFNKLEDKVDKLKRGVNYASEAGSCQFSDNEDVENDAPEPDEPVCPCRPGITECGVYVMKFMKETVQGRVEILGN